MNFELTIIAPTFTKVVSVQWLDIRTFSGNMIICQGHAPLIASLQPKSTLVFKDALEVIETMAVEHGIVTVERSQVVLIVSE